MDAAHIDLKPNKNKLYPLPRYHMRCSQSFETLKTNGFLFPREKKPPVFGNRNQMKSDEIRHILGWFLPSMGPCSPQNGLKSSVLVFPPMDQPIRIAPLSDPQIGEMTVLILHGSSLYTTVCLGSSQRVPPVMFPRQKAHLNGGGFCQFEMLLNHPKKHVANVDL